MTASDQRRAVVVEDDPDIRNLLGRILTKQGFAVVEAGTGAEGLAAVRAGGADLVTLDLNLPDCSGMDVCRELRTFSEAYVMMITARADEVDRLTGFDTGADDYVSKPFSPREITARINALFRRPRTAPVPDTAAESELERAAEVQRSLLPQQPVALSDYDVAGRMTPSKSVGGDFFDWVSTSQGLQLTVADAMGKGMGAALIAATVRAVLRAAGRRPDVAEAFNFAGRALELDLERSQSFITVFHARLEAASGQVQYVDAGHGLALHLHTDGAVDRLAAGGPPVGVWPGQEWSAAELLLEPGDTLAVVSDGVLDAFASVEGFTDAVARVVRNNGTAAGAAEAILALAEGSPVEDDITAVVVRRLELTDGAPRG
ncbi:MAG: response regulator [Micrococcaceae bacterium]|nr:response regulator [Micrococcaceae bacterium]